MMIDTETSATRPCSVPSTCVESRTPRLLVVDDSEFERRCIARLLRGFEGLDVAFATGAVAALEAIEGDPPDLVLTDLVMPDMDGLELVRRVRESNPGLPMILMTAFGGEDAAVEALRAGAADYLPKSRLEKDLATTLRRALDVFAFDSRRHRLMQRLRSRTSTFELDNDPEQIGMLAHVLVEDVGALGYLDRSARIRLRVALQEALVNALYHGNLEVDSELRQEDEAIFHSLAAVRRGQEPYRSRRLLVRIVLDRRAAVFEIADEGPGFDTSRADRQIEIEDLNRIGGRGLLLMRTFMDQVTHNARGNVVTMTMRFAAGRSER
ncbi:response regulator [Planctomyces sp. SH-PL62]|uniref:ATP-binding response regulator n=1 Tax=Planctomyces sp. SH-PL62 TaxID=1636152 RepID=UPI00078D9C0F|nr:response regulator [Planctomyces sp. SH-PL62]AMV37830.1 Transcriptional regulatory protein ZraR [Planctomyces sp. SH-PL62]